MKYKVNKTKNPVKVDLTLEKEEWQQAIEEAYKKTASKYSVEGFRKGKAPRRVIENAYGKGVFYEEAINESFYKYYPEILTKEKDLKPVDMPSLGIKKVNEEELELEILITVEPELKLGAYKGLNINVAPAKVTAKDVDHAIQHEREHNARLVEEKGTIENGFIANIDFEGYVGDKKFDGGTSTDYDLEIGSHSFIDTFEDQLIGLKAGETKDVNVKFPDNYGEPSLAGKPATFKVKINAVKRKELPELNDEFASNVSQFETLEEYKKDVKNNLVKQSEQAARVETENQILDKIVETTQVDIPASMIDAELDNIIKDIEYKLMYQGLKLKDYLNYLQIDEQSFRKTKRQEAEKSVKMRLAMQEIIRLEKMDVTSKEVDARLQEQAKNAGKSLKEYKESISEQQLRYVENDILLNKLLNFLVENNK